MSISEGIGPIFNLAKAPKRFKELLTIFVFIRAFSDKIKLLLSLKAENPVPVT